LRTESTLRDRRRRPTHPGALLREDILPDAGLTQTRLAALLRVSRRTVNEIMQERRPVTPDMAHRLARVFRTTPEFWLAMQQALDVWKTRQANRATYNRIRFWNRSGSLSA